MEMLKIKQLTDKEDEDLAQLIEYIAHVRIGDGRGKEEALIERRGE